MNDSTKRMMIRLYFARFPIKPVLVLLGLGVLLSWTRPGLWLLALGVLYAAVLVAAAVSRPTDQQIDDWLSEDTERLRVKALDMLDLEERDIETEMLQLAGPLTRATSLIPRDDIRFRRGRDDTYRVSANKVLILCPTEHFLGVFHCVYDSLREQVFYSEATRYAYRNVVSVKKGENAEVLKDDEPNVLKTRAGKELIPTQFFSMSISNGEHFMVPMRARISESHSPGMPPMTELDKTVKALNKLLQSKFEAA